MSEDAAAQKVRAHLQQKYGEEFVVEAAGGGFGTGDNTTWKVVFHPASDPFLRSYATIPKSGGEISDYYTGARVAREYARSLEPEVAAVVGSRVHLSIDVRHMAGDGREVGGRMMRIDEFVERNQGAEFLIGVLTDANLNDDEVNRVLIEIGRHVAETIPRGRVFLACVDGPTYEAMVASPQSSERQDVEQRALAWININESKVSSPIRR